MRKLTYEYVYNKLKERNFTLLSDYKNTRTKIHVKCDTCGYEWDVRPNTLLNNVAGCPQCAGVIKKSTEDFIFELNNINPNIEIMNDYINNKTKIRCRCTIDNNIWEATPQNLLKGQGCPKCKGRCTSERLMMSDYDFLQKLVINNPTVIALEPYIGSKTKILFKCTKCNYEWKSSPNSILSGEGCPVCAKNLHYTPQQFLKKAKENKNITLLDSYVNSKTKLRCKCNICNNEFYMLPSFILKGYKCPLCRKHKTRSHEDFVAEMHSINPNIIIQDIFKGTKTPIKVKCKICDNEWSPIPNMLLQGCGCMKCYRDNNRGENHPLWNPNLSKEDRIKGRRYDGYVDWVNNVFERDNWTCQTSGKIGYELRAHHLDGYNWCIEKRLDLNNGITLSDEVHKEFHSIYGNGNNTREQFLEFIEMKYKRNQIPQERYLILKKKLNLKEKN